MRKRIALLCMVILIPLMFHFSSYATTISQASKALREAKNQISTLEKEKKETQKNLLNDKKTRDTIIADLEKKGYEASQIEFTISEIESAIESLDKAIAQTQLEYDEELKLFQERIVVLYQKSKETGLTGVVFKAESLSDLFKNVQNMKVVAKYDQNLMDSLSEKQSEIDLLNNQKHQEVENAQAKLEANLEELNSLEVSRASVNDRIENSTEALKKIEADEDALNKEAEEMGRFINLVGTKAVYSGGIMGWPTPGYYKISSPFGYRIHPILKIRKFHSGIDINAPFDAYIHAAANGIVISSGYRSGGSGNTIIIDHGGSISTLYFHIRRGGLLVQEGQIVKTGDVIAKVGSTGLSTGPHLHFEVRKNGVAQNPLKYVTKK